MGQLSTHLLTFPFLTSDFGLYEGSELEKHNLFQAASSSRSYPVFWCQIMFIKHLGKYFFYQ